MRLSVVCYRVRTRIDMSSFIVSYCMSTKPYVAEQQLLNVKDEISHHNWTPSVMLAQLGAWGVDATHDAPDAMARVARALHDVQRFVDRLYVADFPFMMRNLWMQKSTQEFLLAAAQANLTLLRFPPLTPHTEDYNNHPSMRFYMMFATFLYNVLNTDDVVRAETESITFAPLCAPGANRLPHQGQWLSECAFNIVNAHGDIVYSSA
jgi:hypothetical protein